MINCGFIKVDRKVIVCLRVKLRNNFSFVFLVPYYLTKTEIKREINGDKGKELWTGSPELLVLKNHTGPPGQDTCFTLYHHSLRRRYICSDVSRVFQYSSDLFYFRIIFGLLLLMNFDFYICLFVTFLILEESS